MIILKNLTPAEHAERRRRAYDGRTEVARVARTYSLRLRGDEWQVMHGNKIVARYLESQEDIATQHARDLIAGRRSA